MLLETFQDVTRASVVNSGLLQKLEAKICGLLSGEWVRNTGGSASAAVLASSHHLQAGGSRMRGHCALHAGLRLGLSKSDALCVAASAELLHNASLIHDDLQDRDDTRRGLPAVWKKFGSGVAICTGDLMLSAAYASLGGLSDSRKIPAVLALVHERTKLAIQGQCEDLGAFKNASINLAEYIRIVTAKSGSLLSLPLELSFVASGKTNWLAQARDAAEAFAVAYQIADDLADVSLDKNSNSLNICLILESREYGTNALACAHALGNQYLDKAMALSRELPFDSGSVISKLSFELRPNFAGGSDR
jgi:geranylgeranyl pyrophosphate synthase